MLKWAVNGPYRQSYLPTVGENTTTTTNTNTTTTAMARIDADQDYTIRRRSTTADASSARRRCSLPAQSTAVRKLRRKSSDICSLRRKLHGAQDKENHLTSTPLPTGLRNAASPLRKLGSLKDLSNITPEKFTANALHTPIKKIETSGSKPLPLQYASTLPTFDVEYSPCGLVPGPILALRGIGIADNYFEKPRYLTQEFKELDRKDEKRNTKMSTSAPPIDEESSLSSSKMGDLTLERMIDAILESARKDRKIHKLKQPTQQRHQHQVMSPTYTPADDPASDLHEFWDSQSEKYQQEQDPATRLSNAVFNEREVRTPDVFEKLTLPKNFQDAVVSCQLRRQRAVRRKRKLTDLKCSVKNSAQKLLLKRKSLGDRLDSPKRLDTPKMMRNVSPDSGRNSSSDLDDSTLDAGNFTKRRLSFTANDLKQM